MMHCNSVGDVLVALKTGAMQVDATSVDFGVHGVQAVAQELCMNTSLQALDLSTSHINDHEQLPDAAWLAYALRSNRSLLRLNLGWNRIGFSGAKAIAEAVLMGSTLTELNLVGNTLGPEAASLFGELLSHPTFLQVLDLGTTGLEGHIEPITNALYANQSLRTLKLTANKVDDSGAKLLAEMLRSNTSLVSLNLAFNNIGDLGLSQMGEALKLNSSLRSLHLFHNAFGEEGRSSFAMALEQNWNLVEVIGCQDKNRGPSRSFLLVQAVLDRNMKPRIVLNVMCSPVPHQDIMRVACSHNGQPACKVQVHCMGTVAELRTAVCMVLDPKFQASFRPIDFLLPNGYKIPPGVTLSQLFDHESALA